VAADDTFHLGYRPEELAGSPYARFYKPVLAPLPGHVREAVAVGGVPHELMPPVGDAGRMQDEAEWPFETGYTRAPDGSARVFILTRMPRVTPAMWDWWFAWHGSEAARYKLWHPRAHIHAVWSDRRSDLDTYVGRTSNVVEYVGASRLRLTIRFLPPSQLGFDEARLRARGEVAICARGGMAGTPLETGYLVHYVQPVEGGSIMRSRFWVGGDNIAPAPGSGLGGRLARSLARRFVRLPEEQPHDLLIHCAQEMNHLAAILPELYAAFGPTGTQS
jgi:hypothetical protein